MLRNAVAPPAEPPGAGAGPDGGVADAARIAALTSQLLAGEVAVQDDFLDAAQVRKLRDCADARRNRGEFRSSRIGGGALARPHADIRGDSIVWWCEPLSDAERALLRDLEQLRRALNADSFLGLFDLELHYARYPPGAGYRRHVDQPHGSGDRILSLVLYLNEAWQAGDGGELRVFAGGETWRDIAPIAGRMVCFLTAGLAHSVLPTRRSRLSITGWYRHRDPAYPAPLEV